MLEVLRASMSHLSYENTVVTTGLICKGGVESDTLLCMKLRTVSVGVVAVLVGVAGATLSRSSEAQTVCPLGAPIHVVAKQGDTYSKIAAAHNTTLSCLLRRPNATSVSDANGLRIGDILHVVPGTPPVTTTSTTTLPATTTTTRPTTTTTTTTTLPLTTTSTSTTTPPPTTSIPNIPTSGSTTGLVIPGIIPNSSANEPSGNFRSFCAFSHLAYADPIVYPNTPGSVGHLHQFFGNAAVSGTSTYQSLRTTGNSTCQGGILNRTGYWAPALFNNAGSVLVPNYFGMYYKANGGSQASIQAVQDYPNGLRMIAGYDMANPTNTSFPYGADTPQWTCNGNSRTNLASFTSTTCPAGQELKVGVRFPQCWNGETIDSSNHRSHMSYATGGGGWFTSTGGCPSTHPIRLPEFTAFIAWTSDGNVAQWYLSSDKMPGMTHANGETFHTDWFGAWDNEIQNRWITGCIRQMRDCNFGEMGDGTQLSNGPNRYTGPKVLTGYTPFAA